jgi:ATP-dependent helicase/nuclease subunit A
MTTSRACANGQRVMMMAETPQMSKRVKQRGEVNAETRAEQGKASDPAKSVWVSANAGSGKTHVLSERVIRLLLNDVEPSCIICLTYTKAAAAVMANRVFERLSEWIALDDAKLSAAIIAIGEPQPTPKQLRKARRLFARALETPGGLRIQTIHAFCQSVLGRFPLEANIAGHFDLLGENATKQFLEEAIKSVLREAGDGVLQEPLARLIGKYGEYAVGKLIEDCLKSRDRIAITEFARAVADNPAPLYEFLQVGPEETEESIAAEVWPIHGAGISSLQKIVSAGKLHGVGARGKTFARIIETALATNEPFERFECLSDVLKSEGGISWAKDISSALSPHVDLFPDILSAIETALMEAKDKIQRLRSARLTFEGFRIVGGALGEYASLKSRRALLDYDDIIYRTEKLLNQAGASEWVQYKLDQGIGHLLIDEAQDTNPAQWAIIKSLSEEFFSGEGASGKQRTLFAVGDEKQSIYSFQGARPEVFSGTGRETERRAQELYQRAKLNLSFRSTSDVLDAVDTVFSFDDNRRGLSPTNDYERHTSIRLGGPGRVEVWPLVLKDKAPAIPEDWTAGVRNEADPAVRLAAAIASTIEDWIGNRTVNSATGYPIEARDIMVLARRRGSFVNALSRELKSRNIAVSGADRLVLTSHIAVKDLLAIARVCLMPGDDLSLAALLRSPLHAFTDPELMDLAARRKPGETLYGRLVEFAAKNPKCASALAEIEGWRNESARLPVFDFYARILGRNHVRARLIQRLGIEAADVIDEFLSYALSSERAGLTGLQDFVETLEAAAPEIKREMSNERDEVRILTAHAAKGQEAPIVFLVDPVSTINDSATVINVSNGAPLFIWEPAKEHRSSSTASARAGLKQREEEEFRRLLYVGMTRAEDQLIVCGFGTTNIKPDAAGWVNMVLAGLGHSDHLSRIPHPHLGQDIHVWQTGTKPTPVPDEDSDESRKFEPLPLGFGKPMPPVRLVPRPLSPSGVSLAIEPEASAAASSPVLSNTDTQPSNAILRGQITHRLLESLPGIPSEAWPLIARQYTEKAAPDWSEARRTRVVEDVLGVLNTPRFASAFTAGSRAEVSVMGHVNVRGETRKVCGKIDRIAVEDGRIVLLDFKTDFAPPRSAAEVPASYLTQMALYRAIIQSLYPDKPVECALLYTSGASLIALPPERMDAELEALAKS